MYQAGNAKISRSRNLARSRDEPQPNKAGSLFPRARALATPPPLPPPTPPQTDGLPEMWPSAWFAPQTRASNAYVCPERRMRQLAPSTTQTKQKHGFEFPTPRAAFAVSTFESRA